MKTDSKKIYVPVTPAGSVLMHLESSTEEKAWKRLMREAAHMPYPDQAAFEARGYEVIEMESDNET